MGHDILDLVIVITLAFFTVNGFFKGLIREIASICALVFGFWGASAWHSQLAPYLEFISDPNWRTIAACVIIFFAILFLVGFVARVLEKIATISFVGWINRIAGAVLGFAKGFLLWLVLLIALQAFFQDAQFLRESRATPYFNSLIPYIQQWLPPELAKKLAPGQAA